MNKELDIITSRLNRVGDKLNSYEEILKTITSDSDYENQEIIVYVFKAGEEYEFSESEFTVGDYTSIEELRADIQNNVIASKKYKRPTAWGKKLYEYTKLNNFTYVFVVAHE